LVVTCGATEAMMVAMMTVCDPGDRVGMFSPFYENYNADAILTGATPVHVPLHAPEYRFDPAELRAAFAGGLKAFMLCNPSNPCGRVFTREELAQIAALAQEFDTFVITDEVYEHIVYPPHRHTYLATLPGMAERTLSCSSLSKTFAITGWRLGYVHSTRRRSSRKPARSMISSRSERPPRCSMRSSRAEISPGLLHATGGDYAAGRELAVRRAGPGGAGAHPARGGVFCDGGRVAAGLHGRCGVRQMDGTGDRGGAGAGLELLPAAGAPLRAAQFCQVGGDAAGGRGAAAAAAAGGGDNVQHSTLNVQLSRGPACAGGFGAVNRRDGDSEAGSESEAEFLTGSGGIW
jgi:hypothetical protein